MKNSRGGFENDKWRSFLENRLWSQNSTQWVFKIEKIHQMPKPVAKNRPKQNTETAGFRT